MNNIEIKINGKTVDITTVEYLDGSIDKTYTGLTDLFIDPLDSGLIEVVEQLNDLLIYIENRLKIQGTE